MRDNREKRLERVLEALILEGRNISGQHGGVSTDCCDLCWAIIDADQALNDEPEIANE